MPVLSIDLEGSEEIPRPKAAAPRLELTREGRRVASVFAPDGQWTHGLIKDAAWRVVNRADLPLLEEAESTRPRPTDPVVVALRDTGGAGASTLGETGERDVEVVSLDADEGSYWESVDRSVRSASSTAVLAFLDTGEPDDRWLRAVRAPLEAERVAVLIGAALPPGSLPGPLELFSRTQLKGPYPHPGRAPEFFGVRREIYEAIGGLDPSLASLGHHAPLTDFVERALEHGYLVARRDAPVPGGVNESARRAAEGERWRARGALLTRDLIASGRLTPLPLPRRGWTYRRPLERVPGQRTEGSCCACSMCGLRPRGSGRGRLAPERSWLHNCR